MQLETFIDVVNSVRKNPRRKFHILLGNGFSIGYDPDIFSYNALHEFVESIQDDDVSTILEVIETSNFEAIMKHLDTFSLLVAALGADKVLRQRIDFASDRLRKSLLDAVRSLHPGHVYKITDTESQTCAAFLKQFINTGGSVFSTNYDLLLYWVLVRNNTQLHNDGFGRELLNTSDQITSREEAEWSELVWGVNRMDQRVFYLHGALHLFDNGTKIVKEQYGAQQYLLEKIAERMNRKEYPLFVAAGDGRQKLNQIKHNEYLNFCYEALCNVEGSLVTFGFAFGESDEHIIEAINRAAVKHKASKTAGRLYSLYVGVYSQADYQRVIEISSKLKCKVHVFDAKTVSVWR